MLSPVLPLHSGAHFQAHTSAQHFAMVSRLNDMFSLVWWVCQKCQPNQQQRVYKPHGIKKQCWASYLKNVIYFS